MNRYLDTQILKTSTGIRYFSTLLYPIIDPTDDDWYVITTVGDRLDLIANEYYGDPTLYPVLYFANPNSGLRYDSIYPPVGIQLRIPADVSAVQTKLDEINKAR